MVRFLIFIGIMFALPVRAEETARLGVFGLVESIDPLVVAGQLLALPEGYRVISPLGPNSKIEVGDTLAIAVNVIDGQLTATRLLEVYPVVGPVSAVEGKTAIVMGTAVHIPPTATIKTGMWVALSGLWSGDRVITTSIRNVGAGGFAHLTGVVNEQEMRVGGSLLHDAPLPKNGFGNDIWLLSGKSNKAGLQVQLMARGVFGDPVDLVLWQGHASGPVASQTYAVHGTGITGAARDADMPDAGALIVRCAQKGRVLNAAPAGLELEFDLLGCASRKLGD